MRARHALQKKNFEKTCGKKYNRHLQINVTPVIRILNPLDNERKIALPTLSKITQNLSLN